MISIICPVCRGLMRIDYGDPDHPVNCTLCNGMGNIRLEPKKYANLDLLLANLKEAKRLLLSVANPYILVPYSVEVVHVLLLDNLEESIKMIETAVTP